MQSQPHKPVADLFAWVLDAALLTLVLSIVAVVAAYGVLLIVT